MLPQIFQNFHGVDGVVFKGDEFDFERRHTALHFRPDVEDKFRGRHHRSADADGLSVFALFDLSCLLYGALHIFKDIARVPQETFTRLGQPQPVVGAVEQCYGKFLFQRVDLFHHRRRRDEERVRGLRKAAAFRYFYKRFQSSVEHFPPLRVYLKYIYYSIRNGKCLSKGKETNRSFR